MLLISDCLCRPVLLLTVWHESSDVDLTELESSVGKKRPLNHFSAPLRKKKERKKLTGWQTIDVILIMWLIFVLCCVLLIKTDVSQYHFAQLRMCWMTWRYSFNYMSTGTGETRGRESGDDPTAPVSVHNTAAWDGHVQPKCKSAVWNIECVCLTQHQVEKLSPQSSNSSQVLLWTQ